MFFLKKATDSSDLYNSYFTYLADNLEIILSYLIYTNYYIIAQSCRNRRM